MTKDIYTIITDKLNANPRFKALVADRMKIYDYPASKSKTPLFVLIYPMEPPSPGQAGSDGSLSVQFYFQVNVEGTNRHDVKEVAAIVRDTMSGFNFGQLSTGLDEYFPETNRFVDARRYRGVTQLYDNNY